MNLGATLSKRDLVHRQLHDVGATSVIRLKIFDSEGIGNTARIKPLTLIRDNQRDSPLDFAAAAGPKEQGATRRKTLQPMVRPTGLVRKQANLPRLRT